MELISFSYFPSDCIQSDCKAKRGAVCDHVIVRKDVVMLMLCAHSIRRIQRKEHDVVIWILYISWDLLDFKENMD